MTLRWGAARSFASLVLHEGRSFICVARQFGHDARLTLSPYGHVINEPPLVWLSDGKGDIRHRSPILS